MLAVSRALPLNGVVGQVDVVVLQVALVSGVGGTRSPEVSFFEEITVHFMRQDYPDSNIKLATVDQGRLFYVLLNYKGFAVR